MQVIALVLCCIAIVVNILCLLAILQIHGKLTAHFRLIISLASSDILIATSVMLHMTNNALFPIYLKPGIGPPDYRRRRCYFVVTKALNTTALNISLLNLMGMAIDLYLAILRPLHYPQLMDKNRANFMISVLWIVAIFCGFSDFFSVIPERKHLDRFTYCEMAYMTPYQDEFTVFSIALICVFIMVFIYMRIYLRINRQHMTRLNHLQEDKTRRSPRGLTTLTRNKKALVTTLMILGSFMLCWLPLCLFQIILVIQVSVDRSVVEPVIAALVDADQYLYDLLLLNAICDPIVYAIRMPEVQFGYRRLYVKCTRRFRRQAHHRGYPYYYSYGERKSACPEAYAFSRQGSACSRGNSKKTTIINMAETTI